MPKRRVVITGIGVISSNGIGKDAFWEAIFKGVSGIRPISLFDTAGLKARLAGEISDFNPADFLGPKGLRTLDRSTRLAASATKLALDDGALQVDQGNAEDIGISLGTTLGSLKSICDFDKDAITEGPHYVNPALFPNTVFNSPASQVSIRFNLRSFCSTISTGFCAGLDAVIYAADFIRLGRAKIVLAGGVEELCVHTFIGFYQAGCLAGVNNGALEISCPFDRRRNGVILGEGAAVLMLEELESALSRKATIYAEIKGYATSFDAQAINSYNQEGVGLEMAMQQALLDAGISKEEVDYINCAANSSKEADLIETGAIKAVFGQQTKKINLSSIKSMLGECFSASGALQLAAAIGSIQRQMIPPTINYLEKDPECDLDYVVNQCRRAEITNVLINTFGPTGGNSSLVISSFPSPGLGTSRQGYS
jgi:3-oxoacyl-[acyl-carrier-protein] synthase II